MSAPLESPSCCALRNNATAWAIGTHHKAGTLLGKQLHAMWSQELRLSQVALATTRHQAQSCRPPNVPVKLRECGGAVGFYGYVPSSAGKMLVSVQQITELQAADAKRLGLGNGQAFKLIHIVRDPVAVCVSGYWYHRTNPTDLIAKKQQRRPGMLLKLGLSDGLVFNAAGQLPMVASMVQWAGILAADRRVLTLGLEDFASDSWNATAALLADFMFPAEEGLGAQARHFLAQPTPFKDESARRSNLSVSHFTLRVDELRAFDAINRSTDPVWSKLYTLRRTLGYVNTADGDPHGWRYAPSRLRDESGKILSRYAHRSPDHLP